MSWGWDQVSAVSSVVGVVGGLLSLVFLIISVRRNAMAIEGATVQSLMAHETNLMITSLQHAPLFLKGCRDISQLTEEESFGFHRLVAAQMSMYYSAYVQYGNALIDDEMWHAFRSDMQQSLKLPGFHSAWKTMEFAYPKSFRDQVTSS